MAKEEQKAYGERLAEEAEETDRRLDLRTLYRITNTLRGRIITRMHQRNTRKKTLYQLKLTRSDHSEHTRDGCHIRHTSSKRLEHTNNEANSIIPMWQNCVINKKEKRETALNKLKTSYLIEGRSDLPRQKRNDYNFATHHIKI